MNSTSSPQYNQLTHSYEYVASRQKFKSIHANLAISPCQSSRFQLRFKECSDISLANNFAFLRKRPEVLNKFVPGKIAVRLDT